MVPYIYLIHLSTIEGVNHASLLICPLWPNALATCANPLVC